MNGRRSYYDVLGIERTASLPQVERAYRFCLEMYGDGALATYSLLDPGEQQEARERVREAYEVLRDPARRRAYDLSLAQPIFRPLREITPTPAPAAVPALGVAPLPTTGATLAPVPVAPAPEPVAPEHPAPAPALSGPTPVALG